MRTCCFILPFTFALSVSAQAVVVDDRLNVMECSHQEVLAYMELPDPARAAMSDYDARVKATRQSTVAQMEESSDPGACAELLYADLKAMGEQLKLATQAMVTTDMTLAQLTEAAMDKMGEAICSRLSSAGTGLLDGAIDEINRAERMALKEINDTYGEKAMNNYINKAVFSENYSDHGLKYRNGGVDGDLFRSNARKKWGRHLEEMKGKSDAGIVFDD
jgi:hypothetical protein